MLFIMVSAFGPVGRPGGNNMLFTHKPPYTALTSHALPSNGSIWKMENGNGPAPDDPGAGPFPFWDILSVCRDSQ